MFGMIAASTGDHSAHSARSRPAETLLRTVPLRCWDARRRVSDYLNGDLDREEAALVERHLGSCPTCPPLYASLVGVQAQLGALRDPDTVVPPDLHDRIRAEAFRDR
jgi:RNA polymerase sigma-70 factor (ECF subfamily)